MNTRKIRLMIASAVIVTMTAGSLAGADEIYSGGVTVDINRDVNGYLWIEDATVNLLENTHIKNADLYGDVYAVSGSVLNIYGGVIDNYLYVTTSYNDMPEAQVTVYGSQFAIDGVAVAEGTPEVFLQAQQLSGIYQNGTPFSHQVDCFMEGDFYLTVKLGWVTSKSKMVVSPTSLDLGQIKVGTTAQQSVTIANEGNANLSLQSVSFVQGSNAGFSYTPVLQLPQTIEPGTTITVNVVFAPAAKGQALGTLKITGDDASAPAATVALTGMGTIPDITVEPESIDFGQILMSTSETKVITIANQGDAELIISSLSWADGSSADFAMSAMPALPMTIQPGVLVELAVVYAPTMQGAAAATLMIQSDDADEALVQVALSGVGVKPDITVEPQSVDFGQLDVGDSAITQNITIGNVGTAKLVIQSLTWAGGSSADFTVAVMPQLPLTIEPDTSVEIMVVYTPTIAGNAAGTLAIQSNDLETPMVNLTVTGKAIAPVPTPYEQIIAMIAFYDESVQNGTIQGVGRGNCAKNNVKMIKEALKITKTLIRCQYKHFAIAALKELDKFTDGKSKPSDLITGSAVAELNTRIDTLLQSLNTEVKVKPKHKCR
jgi:hypothetical protein